MYYNDITIINVFHSGTQASNPEDPNAQWLEYDFKCKPGNVTQMPW